CGERSYPVLAPVSEGYPRAWGRLLTCYSPVRLSSTPKGLSARLPCVKHAASVRPEPGSNSPPKTRENPSNNVAKGIPNQQTPQTVEPVSQGHKQLALASQTPC